jgi:hypothetical protein
VEPVDARDVSGVLGAFALGAAAPLGWGLRLWSARRLERAASFTAGVSLAYVIVDLLVELTTAGGRALAEKLPAGLEVEKSLFAIVLAGATSWYVVGAIAQRLGGPRARYRATLVPRIVYGLFVGGALALEAEHGPRALVLFDLPMLLHLTVVESHIQREFAGQHVGLPRAVLAVAPGLGAAAWAFLGIPESTLFMALALVAGTTFVQILHEDLPSLTVVHVPPFLLGVTAYSTLVALKWTL